MARSRIIAGKAVIIIEAQDLVNKTLGKVRSNLHKFANEVGNLGEATFRTGFFGSIISGAAVHSFVKFDDAMRTLRVNLDLFGKSAKEVNTVMRPLEETIRSLAQTTPFNPTEVANAAKELAKGGFNPKQIIDSLQAVLDLSRATNTELGFSAEFLVRSMTTYGIATDRASEIVSQFVRAARKGTLGIEDLEAAMRYSSGTADTLGVSLQTMLSIFTVLSNRGLVGSIAGTSTNTAFSQLVKKAQQLKDIGKIELVTGIREDGREALDVIASLENLFRFAERLPFTEQQTLFQDIFNLRGARSVAGLRKEIERIKELRVAISDANQEAREAAKIQDAGIGGSLRRLVSTIQDLNISLGKSTEKTITQIAATIKGLLEELNKLAALNPALTSLIILSPGILLAAGVGLLALSKALRVAAVGAGVLRAALRPVGNLLVKGTVGQLTALSYLATKKKAVKQPKIKFTPLPPLPAPTPPTNKSVRRSIDRFVSADNARLAALAAQRQAKAEDLLSKAERNRTRSLQKLSSVRASIPRQIRNEKAALDQNTRSIKDNLRARAANETAARQSAAFQRSIDRLEAERFAIDRRLAQTTTVRSPRGGLRDVTNLPTAEVKRLTADRERLAFQVTKLRKEQAKLNALPAPKFELRQKELLAARAGVLKRINKLENSAVTLTKGKASIETRYVKELTKGQDLLISANKARSNIQSVPAGLSLGSRVGIAGKAAGRSAISGAKSIATFGARLLSFANIARRFAFSFTGVFTILEGLLLFGDRIPGVATVLERFGQAFSNAFRAIGNIAKFAVGPVELLKASIEAFTAGRADIGINALKKAFSLLGTIIKTQVLLAWARFKEALGTVYGLLRQIASGIFQVFNSIVTAIGVTISTIVSRISTEIGVLSRFFGFEGEGLKFDEGASFLSEFVKQITLFASNLPLLFASVIDKMGTTLDIFVLKFELAARYAASLLNPLQSNTPDSEILQKIIDRIEKSNQTQADIEKQRLANIKNTNQQANRVNLPNIGRQIQALVRQSVQAMQQGFRSAEEVRKELAKAVQELTKPSSDFGQGIRGTTPTQEPSVQATRLLADALVGSIQSTRRNLLRPGKQIEEKQLDEQKKTNKYLEAMAQDMGLRFAE